MFSFAASLAAKDDPAKESGGAMLGMGARGIAHALVHPQLRGGAVLLPSAVVVCGWF